MAQADTDFDTLSVHDSDSFDVAKGAESKCEPPAAPAAPAASKCEPPAAPPRAELSQGDMMKAVIDCSTSELLAQATGNEGKLTEENISKLQKALYASANTSSKPESQSKPDAGGEHLTKNEKKNRDALEVVVATGRFDPRTGYGNKFRSMLSEDTDKKKLYENMGPEAAKQFRVDWATNTYNTLTEKSTEKTSWTKDDIHNYKYRTFGRMVKGLGGVGAIQLPSMAHRAPLANASSWAGLGLSPTLSPRWQSSRFLNHRRWNALPRNGLMCRRRGSSDNLTTIQKRQRFLMERRPAL